MNNLGVDEYLKKKMRKEIDVVINSAAATKFFERYDVALTINTLGAMNVIDFAKRCQNIQLLLHVSTAYVCGEKAGPISEKPQHMGEALNGKSCLDIISAEMKLVGSTVDNLKAEQSTKATITEIMRNLGAQSVEEVDIRFE
ncbi:hypothetical protein Ancab_011236 [Ancistrocladus abbreviatus]